jgi:hypothetical protein
LIYIRHIIQNRGKEVYQKHTGGQLIPSVTEWLHIIKTDLHLYQGKSRLVINFTTSFHVRDQVRLQIAQTLRMIKTITNKIQISKSLLYTATQSTSLFTFPSLCFGLYAECISTFLERISTMPSTLNTEATPAQRTSHLIPSVEEWIHRIVTELHLNQGKSRLVINSTEWCYIKRTTDNVLQIVLQASRWRV